MKKGNYEQPKLFLVRMESEDVITASATLLGDDDFGREDVFYD